MLLAALLLAAAAIHTSSAVPLTVPSAPADVEAGQHYAGPQDPNPEIKSSWRIQEGVNSSMPAIHQALIPGTNDVYLILGRNRQGPLTLPLEPIAGIVDAENEKFTPVWTVSNTFCSSIVPTHDGKLVVAGGHGKADYNNVTDGKKDIRVFDYQADPEHLGVTVEMAWGRWYPTPTLRPDHRIAVFGGSIATNEKSPSSDVFEVWDPANPTKSPLEQHLVEPDFLKTVVQNFYPFNFILPTGDMYSQIDHLVRFYKPDGTWRKKADGTYLDAPGFPTTIKTQYPRSATAVMGPLTYKNNYSSVDVVVFGGVPATNPCIHGPPYNQILASRSSFRLTISWTYEAGEPVYEFSEWVEEDMGVARVGGDATLLPNGDVIVANGGQTGCVGGTIKGVRRNLYPAFWPVLYQMDKPKGERYTVMSATGIARMYHATAGLTLNGTLFIAGCDACGPSPSQFQPFLGSGEAWYAPSPTRTLELRTEIFSPPYVFDTQYMPSITKVGDTTDATAVTDVTYGGELTISWKSKEEGAELVDVTSVVLVAPSAGTHSFNNNQRLVVLEITDNTKGEEEGTLTVKLPPAPEVAPPQMYMLFLNNGKTYGRAWWVWLKDA